ncbi:hypothetical protein BH11PSE2_BH11PSE2_02490 [soil metagenome]
MMLAALLLILADPAAQAPAPAAEKPVKIEVVTYDFASFTDKDFDVARPVFVKDKPWLKTSGPLEPVTPADMVAAADARRTMEGRCGPRGTTQKADTYGVWTTDYQCDERKK